VGLYRVSTAEVGPLHHLRLALHGQYFRSTNFLVEGDTNSRLDGSFSFGFTLHESLELFGAILTSSNRNHRCAPTSAPGTCDPEMDRRDPELIKSFGDLVLGGKGVLPVARGFTAGAELGLRFLSSISDLSFSPSSTSFWIGAVASYDLRERTRAPFRVHANANFYLDNSSNLYDFTGTTIYTREVATFAYGIQQSRIRLALGADAPLEQLTAPVPLQPFVEYHAEIVTASADPAFAAAPVPASPNNRDQQWLTFGLRARVYRALTLDAGLDIGLRSVGYAYGPPLAPWDLTFGVSLPLDLDAVMHPAVAVRTVERSAAPATGTVVGTIRSKGDGKPISEAIVGFVGQPHARVATDPDGGFSSGPLPLGPVDVTVAAAGYEPGKAEATVVAGTPTTVEVSLVAKPLSGNVRGRVADAAGRGVAATLRFGGASTFEARTDASGAYSAALPAGPYKVTIEAAGWPNKEVPIDVSAGQDRQLDVTLRSANADVKLTGSAVVLRVPIKFRPGVPQLDSTAKRELDGVAELLADHPEIRKLRIEAHWSGPAGKGTQPGGSGDLARKLTEKQAGVVKDYLVSRGTPAERLEAVGSGGESPLVPNLGPANRAKNRRVELLIVP
jgi:outer membrane protein OmpA-like peptidoglycan-associated protein